MKTRFLTYCTSPLGTIPCQLKVVHILTHMSYFCKFIIMTYSYLHLSLWLSSVLFASSFVLQFVPLCHFPPCKLPMYTRNNILHWLTQQEPGAKNRNHNLTKIILSLNKMKICCFYNSNIYICGMDGWQPIIKKRAWYDVTMAHSGRHFSIQEGMFIFH